MGTYIIDGTAREAIAEPVKRCTVSELRTSFSGRRRRRRQKKLRRRPGLRRRKLRRKPRPGISQPPENGRKGRGDRTITPRSLLSCCFESYLGQPWAKKQVRRRLFVVPEAISETVRSTNMQIMTAAWIKIGSKDSAPYPGKNGKLFSNGR
jgi:hypothetical protein